MNYVYMLECADKSLYTGWTNDIEKRVRTHSAGRGAKYTRSRLPVRLVYLECHEERNAAKSREFALKRLTHEQKLRLIASSKNKLKKEVVMDYGLQLFSVRDITGDDFFGALKAVREIGYKFIEPAGFFGHSAEEVKAKCQELGLAVSGSHSGFQDLLDRFEETVAYHKEIGNKNYIVPGVKLQTKADVDFFVENANRLAPLLEKEGIRLSYHNHSGEFKPNDDGVIPYDEIVSRTNIGLEIDTFWAYAAGKDPVALMEQLKDRLVSIHIKDGFEDGRGMPLGMGTAPVKEVYQKAKELGILMVVESETLTPDGLTEASICYNYLKNLE